MELKEKVFQEMTNEELVMNDGGAVPVAIAIAFLTLLGTGYTAGINVGLKKWF